MRLPLEFISVPKRSCAETKPTTGHLRREANHRSKKMAKFKCLLCGNIKKHENAYCPYCGGRTPGIAAEDESDCICDNCDYECDDPDPDNCPLMNL